MESKQFQFLVENSPDTIFIYDIASASLTYTNHPTFLGYSLSDLTFVSDITNYIHADDLGRVKYQWRKIVKSKRETGYIEFRMQNSVGEWEWVRTRYTLFNEAFADKPSHLLVTANLITARKVAELKQQQYAARLELLYQTNQAILATLDPREIAKIALGSLRQLIHCQRVSVSIMDVELDQVDIIAVESDNTTRITTGVRPSRVTSMHHLSAGQPYIVDDISQLMHPSSLHRQLAMEGIRSFVVIPLLIQNELIGTIQIGWEHVNGSTTEYIDIAKQVTNSIAIAIHQARLYERAEARTRELEVLAEISTELREMQSVMATLPIILEKATAVIGGVSGSIFLVEEKSNDLVARCAYPHDSNMQARRRKWGAGITGRVAATGEIFMSQDLMQDTMAHMIVSEVDQLQRVRSCIAVPLRTQKRVIGVMHVGLLERHHFTKAEIRLLTAVSEIASNSLARSMLLETLEQRVADRTHELQAANERLQELDRLKSKFVSDVSHELRTPVTNLGLYLDLLEKGQPEKRPHYMQILRQQEGRLGQLIEDILSLSRLDMHAPAMKNFAAVDLNALVKQIVSTHHVVAETMGLELSLNLQETPFVWGNANQLAQVVTNLLVNAISYTPTGYVKVCTCWDQSRNQVGLTVKDSGIGIGIEEQFYIFDRFYRGEQVSQSSMPGTGLGLSIVSEIVYLHEGEIQLHSELEVGSVFRVWLPIAAGEKQTIKA